ncbi:hypothetical protein GCM10009789_65070 [Kribbella sancticallisti]|uniref:RelA/SpoT domain-containing protein n=1 Tax=Kribbella sancticallisti TaxID=460087 RepID=A0ABN2EAZ4_9ACTN
MPPPGLAHLPEPKDLHAQLNSGRPLDWGDPVPTKDEIAAEFGPDATRRSLTLLARASEIEQQVTDDVVSTVGPGAVAYQLENRLKSPHSLARKLQNREGSNFDAQPLEDLIRYTIVAPDPDDIVKTASAACDSLMAKGWTMESAHHSYVDDSRYKGLHLFLEIHGERVELQLHSRESIDVKTRTTPLYLIERDRQQPKSSRDTARQECIALSDQMRQPAGIDDLAVLGGVAVSTRRYGKGRQQPKPRGEVAQAAQPQAAPRQRLNAIYKDGISQ